MLAAAAELGAPGDPIGFTVAALVGVGGAGVAYRSLLSPPPAPVLAFAGHHSSPTDLTVATARLTASR